jgi:hypothetical protein
MSMRVSRTLVRASAATAGAALLLSGCGDSYEDSRELYAELQDDFECEALDGDAYGSFGEGELAPGFPAFDLAQGSCQQSGQDIEVQAVMPHDVSGKEFLDTLTEMDDTEGYAVQSKKWVVLIEDLDAEQEAFAKSVEDELGGKLVTLTGEGGGAE